MMACHELQDKIMMRRTPEWEVSKCGNLDRKDVANRSAVISHANEKLACVSHSSHFDVAK